MPVLPTAAPLAAAATLGGAIVTGDPVPLRAGPRDSAQAQAQLWQGELLEVRGERLDYLQVWDPKRERGGFVRAGQVRRTALAESEAPELLAVLRFVREAPGQEALGIGLAAAWLRAAPPEALRGSSGAEALHSLGLLADRLAGRASHGAALPRAAQTAAAAHLEVAAGYGIRFHSYEQQGRMRVCYDGEAFRRVLAMPAASPLQQAQSALALTQPECIDPALQPLALHEVRKWQAAVLDRVATAPLPAYVANRVHMRRAAVWSALAYEHARLGQASQVAAKRALDALAAVQREQLPEQDAAAHNDTVMRVNASRWAAALSAGVAASAAGARPSVLTVAGSPGETCVLLVDAKHGADQPLGRRCTYGVVWTASATLNREGNALALAVQPLAGWRELWLWRKRAAGWTAEVVPPAALAPDLGYAEFAGWVPGGREVLVAREARSEGRYRRSYEVLSLDSLATLRQAAEPGVLGPFQRWQDAGWKRLSVGLR